MDVARENVLAERVSFDASGRPVPSGIRAEAQTAGRGQRGRHWFALPGACLCATYYFGWGLVAPETAGQLAFLAGVAVVEGLAEEQNSFLIPHPSSLSLKWPNDVLLNGRKVGGILIELAQTPEQEWVALIGVGINVRVREFPAELADYATSLWREGVEVEDIGALAEAIAGALEHFAQVRREQGFEAILAHWRTYDVTPGRIFETTLEGKTVQGIADSVEADGALRLRLADDSLLRVLSASSVQEKQMPIRQLTTISSK